MDILTKLTRSSAERLEQDKKTLSLAEVRRLTESLTTPPPSFSKALTAPKISFICEIKRASPSKGVISKDFPYLDIADDYLKAGAAALSVLTEPKYFLGSDKYLEEIAASSPLAVLRKDFTIDEYQIYQARVLGAAAVLLIASILDDGKLREFISLAAALDLAALVEVHDKLEAERALKVNAAIIGVNNRNLKTFEVDLNNCLNLRKFIPPEIIFVAESGIHSRYDVKALEAGGVNAALVGEALMTASCRQAKLFELRGITP